MCLARNNQCWASSEISVHAALFVLFSTTQCPSQLKQLYLWLNPGLSPAFPFQIKVRPGNHFVFSFSFGALIMTGKWLCCLWEQRQKLDGKTVLRKCLLLGHSKLCYTHTLQAENTDDEMPFWFLFKQCGVFFLFFFYYTATENKKSECKMWKD